MQLRGQEREELGFVSQRCGGTRPVLRYAGIALNSPSCSWATVDPNLLLLTPKMVLVPQHIQPLHEHKLPFNVRNKFSVGILIKV